MSSLELAKSLGEFDGEIPTFNDIGVDFDDGIFVDKKQQLQFYGQAKQFGFIPSVKAIERLWNLPTEEAERWESEILEDQTEVDPSYIRQQNEEGLYGAEE